MGFDRTREPEPKHPRTGTQAPEDQSNLRTALDARLSGVAAWILLLPLSACGHALPTQPSAIEAPSARVLSLEAEAGGGDGQVIQRSRASGGQTVHLGPGQHRRWPIAVRAAEVQYALSVTYSNGKEGENEVITVSVDGAAVHSFQNRDTGDSIEGWNVFVIDPAGTSTLRSGSHLVELEVSGGDGCVEIDLVTLSPAGGGT